MKFLTKYLIDYFSELYKIAEEAVTKMLYTDALSEFSLKIPKGFLSLAKMYESGNCFLSRDTALAYAMYCLYVKEKPEPKVVKETEVLREKLTARDWDNVNRKLTNFDNRQFNA